MKKLLIISLAAVAIITLAVGSYFVVRSGEKNTGPATDPVVTVPVQQPIRLVDGRQCYVYAHDATTDAPYTTNEFIDMTITGTAVTGTKHGTQSGPDMTNGYTGTITGTLTGTTISVAFAYTVEGSQNTEHEIYQAGLTGIDKLRYPLIDKFKDGLFPDTTKSYTLLHYARVPCEASN